MRCAERPGPALARQRRQAVERQRAAREGGARAAGRKPNEIVWLRPPLYDKQRQAIFEPTDLDGNPARYSFIEASTKAGKTHGCICWLAEQAVLHGAPGRNYWWVAPVYPQADIAFKRMKRALTCAFKATETPLKIELFNGATIWFKSAEKPDNLYGEDVHAAVIDEASRCREDSWNAIRSTLTATRGPMRAIGNVKGRKNWFFRLSRQAQQGKARWAFYKMTAYDAVAGGVLAAEEIEDAKAALPDHVFRELYLAEPADDGGNPFNMAAIAKCVKPMSGNSAIVLGADLAKSVDWTVVIGLDRAGDTCGYERWQAPWDVTTERLHDIIGDLPALIDETGVGSPIVGGLQKRLYRVEGYVFSSKSKQLLMEGLAAAIQRGEVGYPDGPIREELEQFEYVYTRTGVLYSAPEGYHDDCVMALALAVEMRRRQGVSGLAVGPVGLESKSMWFDDMTGTGYEE